MAKNTLTRPLDDLGSKKAVCNTDTMTVALNAGGVQVGGAG